MGVSVEEVAVGETLVGCLVAATEVLLVVTPFTRVWDSEGSFTLYPAPRRV